MFHHSHDNVNNIFFSYWCILLSQMLDFITYFTDNHDLLQGSGKQMSFEVFHNLLSAHNFPDLSCRVCMNIFPWLFCRADDIDTF